MAATICFFLATEVGPAACDGAPGLGDAHAAPKRANRSAKDTADFRVMLQLTPSYCSSHCWTFQKTLVSGGPSCGPFSDAVAAHTSGGKRSEIAGSSSPNNR